MRIRDFQKLLEILLMKETTNFLKGLFEANVMFPPYAVVQSEGTAEADSVWPGFSLSETDAFTCPCLRVRGKSKTSGGN